MIDAVESTGDSAVGLVGGGEAGVNGGFSVTVSGGDGARGGVGCLSSAGGGADARVSSIVVDTLSLKPGDLGEASGACSSSADGSCSCAGTGWLSSSCSVLDDSSGSSEALCAVKPVSELAAAVPAKPGSSSVGVVLRNSRPKGSPDASSVGIVEEAGGW